MATATAQPSFIEVIIAIGGVIAFIVGIVPKILEMWKGFTTSAIKQRSLELRKLELEVQEAQFAVEKKSKKELGETDGILLEEKDKN